MEQVKNNGTSLRSGLKGTDHFYVPVMEVMTAYGRRRKRTRKTNEQTDNTRPFGL